MHVTIFYIGSAICRTHRAALGPRFVADMGIMIGNLVRAWRKRPDAEAAGFGQSLLDDLRYWVRFLRHRRRAMVWREPSDEERRVIEVHPVIARFGDMTPLVVDVAGRRWIVRERDWWGWPDPPRYVVFALRDGRIDVAVDFTAWPSCWRPDPASLGPATGRGGATAAPPSRSA